MTASGLIDTNVLVYRHDPSEPAKQRRASEFVRDLVARDAAIVPWQALTEFVAVTTRPRRGGPPLLTRDDARTEAETLAALFPVVLPTIDVFHTALEGVASHRLPWWDALLWATAARAGVPVVWSEDFAHGRVIGGVRIVDPFR